MELLRDFSMLNREDVVIAGGKGASLGEMTQADMPVPPGFVVLSNAFEKFLEETDLGVEINSILHLVNRKEIHTIDDASEKIKALILQAEMPKDIAKEIKRFFKKLNTKYVAVRSSATAEDSSTAAWAGQLESYLNTTEKDLLENVKRCWASLFTPRAIFYRFEKDLHKQKISVAVVVQKMVESEVSGVAFSVHPVTQDRNQLIIEAGFGLGEAIVSGQITPDSYVVEKEPRNILDINVEKQERGLFRSLSGGNEWREIAEPKMSSQVLIKEQILELAETIIKIENHYGFPVDIEWAFADKKFYIVQSRPITTLSKQPPREQNITFIPSEYIRMFAGKSFPYLFSNVFLGYYKKLEVLSIQGDNSWISFFPKRLLKETMKRGGELYTSETLYRKYKAGFDRYIRSSRNYFESIIKKNKISHEEVERFFKHISNFFTYYSKTEFFYTDGINQKEMVMPIKEFDILKLTGRAYLNKIFFENDGYIKNLIKIISRQTKTKEIDLLNYGIKELVELVKTRKNIIKGKVHNRHTFFESKELVLFGFSAESLIQKFFSDYLKVSDVIRGTIANKGRVKGKARVFVPDAKNFNKIIKDVKEMKRGEVLVAETTSPEIIVACNKAAAIIANQGGQLSHAAIISRELGIPCIIGTDKDVILNIKTGDELEVDADKGIVKILK